MRIAVWLLALSMSLHGSAWAGAHSQDLKCYESFEWLAEVSPGGFYLSTYPSAKLIVVPSADGKKVSVLWEKGWMQVDLGAPSKVWNGQYEQSGKTHITRKDTYGLKLTLPGAKKPVYVGIMPTYRDGEQIKSFRDVSEIPRGRFVPAIGSKNGGMPFYSTTVVVDENLQKIVKIGDSPQRRTLKKPLLFEGVKFNPVALAHQPRNQAARSMIQEEFRMRTYTLESFFAAASEATREDIENFELLRRIVEEKATVRKSIQSCAGAAIIQGDAQMKESIAAAKQYLERFLKTAEGE